MIVSQDPALQLGRSAQGSRQCSDMADAASGPRFVGTLTSSGSTRSTICGISLAVVPPPQAMVLWPQR
jgi:hypothetical protein